MIENTRKLAVYYWNRTEEDGVSRDYYVLSARKRHDTPFGWEHCFDVSDEDSLGRGLYPNDRNRLISSTQNGVVRAGYEKLRENVNVILDTYVSKYDGDILPVYKHDIEHFCVGRQEALDFAKQEALDFAKGVSDYPHERPGQRLYWQWYFETEGADLGTEIFGVKEKDTAIKMFVRIATNNMG